VWFSRELLIYGVFMKKMVFVLSMLAASGAMAATEKNKKVQNITCVNASKECSVVLENRTGSAHPTCFMSAISIPGSSTDKSFAQSTLSLLLTARSSGQTVTVNYNVLANGRCEMTDLTLGTTL
jgi:hypothetical protein